MLNVGVYFVGNREHGWYKIGRSKDVAKRLAQLQEPKLPFGSLELIDVYHGPMSTSALEALLHLALQDKRLHGEWFALTEDEVLRFRQMVYRLIKGLGEDCGLLPK